MQAQTTTDSDTFQKDWSATVQANANQVIEAIKAITQGKAFTFEATVDVKIDGSYFLTAFTGINDEGSLVSEDMGDTDDFVTYELDELPVESLIGILARIETQIMNQMKTALFEKEAL